MANRPGSGRTGENFSSQFIEVGFAFRPQAVAFERQTRFDFPEKPVDNSYVLAGVVPVVTEGLRLLQRPGEFVFGTGGEIFRLEFGAGQRPSVAGEDVFLPQPQPDVAGLAEAPLSKRINIQREIKTPTMLAIK